MARDLRRLDVRRIAIAAVEEAFDQLEESKRKKRNRRGLPAKGALITGAALMTAGRVAWSSRGRGMLDALEQRLSGLVGRDGSAEPDDEEEFYEPEDEEAPEAYDEEEDLPEGVEDEDYDEEPEDYEEEPEGDEEEEPEGSGEEESEEDFAGDEAGQEEPEVESAKPQRRSRAGSRNKRRN
jgi:hypothetical protein